MLNNYPTNNSYMIHLAEEMKSVFEGVGDNETKVFVLDDIYTHKVYAWKWSDEELAYLNAVYDRYMKELLS
nr:MAG TPA: hypothetical protein [Caudoviricetes sp.]